MQGISLDFNAVVLKRLDATFFFVSVLLLLFLLAGNRICYLAPRYLALHTCTGTKPCIVLHLQVRFNVYHPIFYEDYINRYMYVQVCK